MTADQCFELGYITKTHGINGEVSAYLDVDFPEDYTNLESVFVQTITGSHTLVPFFIESILVRNKRAIIAFEDVPDIEAAKEMVGQKLFLPLDQLPSLKENQFYYHEIVGFTVWDQQHGELGVVDTVYDTGANHLIALQFKGEEVLIPIVDEVVVSVNRDNEQVITNLPDGLIDLYLEK